jgi:hypothetical protein
MCSHFQKFPEKKQKSKFLIFLEKNGISKNFQIFWEKMEKEKIGNFASKNFHGKIFQQKNPPSVEGQNFCQVFF